MSAPSLQEAEKLYTSATRLELSGDYDGAFKSYVSAAQAFISVKKSSSNNNNAQVSERAKLQAARCLDRAEKLKKLRPALRAPLRDILHPEEQQRVLDASARVSGVLYPLWTEKLPAELQETVLFHDTSFPLKVSATTEARWVRAAELGFRPVEDAGQVAQSALSNCSVVAAILACIAYNTKHGTRLAWSAVQSRTAFSPNGAYCVKLNWNGSYRQVGAPGFYVASGDDSKGVCGPSLKLLLDSVVDDKLPLSETGVALSATSSNMALWVPILEKAVRLFLGPSKEKKFSIAADEHGAMQCLKLHGKGYTFDGSDPAFDLWTMTGWIPGILPLDSSKAESTWSSLQNDFSKGRCLLTAGTGHVEDGWDALIPRHAYVVSRLSHTDSTRTVELLNPWTSEDSTPASSSFSLPWELFCRRFRHLYFNWSPEVFCGRSEPARAVHFGVQKDEEMQFTISTTGASDVWLVLVRHLTGAGQDEDSYISLSALREGRGHDNVVFRYTSQNYVTAKLSPTGQPNATWDIYVSAKGPQKVHNTSLFVYTTSPVDITAVADTLQYKEQVSGMWNTGIGGSHDSPTFYTNPQYLVSLDATQAANLDVRIVGDIDQSVNLKLLRGTERVSNPTVSDVVADSKSYAYGTARLRLSSLSAGRYVLVCSRYALGLPSSFKLSLQCDKPFNIKNISSEGAGMFRQELSGLCEPSGRKSYWIKNNGPLNLTARAHVEATEMGPAVQAQATIQITRPGESGPTVTSGAPSDAPSGAVLRLVKLMPSDQGYIITASFASRLGPTNFRFFLYSSGKLDLKPLSSGEN